VYVLNFDVIWCGVVFIVIWCGVYYYVVGVYSERSVGTSYVVTQRLYVHRTLRSLIVVEVNLERFDVSEPLQLTLELNRWVASYDLTFVTRDSDREEVRSDLLLHLTALLIFLAIHLF